VLLMDLSSPTSTHCNYVCILYHFRYIIFLVENRHFSPLLPTPVSFETFAMGLPLGPTVRMSISKNRVSGLAAGELQVPICLRSIPACDEQTDRQPAVAKSRLSTTERDSKFCDFIVSERL